MDKMKSNKIETDNIELNKMDFIDLLIQETDLLIQERIKEYEKEHGEFPYYTFKDGEICGVSEDELMKSLLEIDEKLKNVSDKRCNGE